MSSSWNKGESESGVTIYLTNYIGASVFVYNLKEVLMSNARRDKNIRDNIEKR